MYNDPAYPFPVPEYRGINRQVPNFFLSDLDKKNFKTDRLFQQSFQNTLQNFKDKLHGANPTVLWSGGGYHLLQPLDANIGRASLQSLSSLQGS
ncbi:MAG: hypothetical protein WA323_07265 [Candidatus Nitrosopolaris sp.]|jgi:hypothetical protein